MHFLRSHLNIHHHENVQITVTFTDVAYVHNRETSVRSVLLYLPILTDAMVHRIAGISYNKTNYMH